MLPLIVAQINERKPPADCMFRANSGGRRTRKRRRKRRSGATIASRGDAMSTLQSDLQHQQTDNWKQNPRRFMCEQYTYKFLNRKLKVLSEKS